MSPMHSGSDDTHTFVGQSPGLPWRLTGTTFPSIRKPQSKQTGQSGGPSESARPLVPPLRHSNVPCPTPQNNSAGELSPAYEQATSAVCETPTSPFKRRQSSVPMRPSFGQGGGRAVVQYAVRRRQAHLADDGVCIHRPACAAICWCGGDTVRPGRGGSVSACPGDSGPLAKRRGCSVRLVVRCHHRDTCPQK